MGPVLANGEVDCVLPGAGPQTSEPGTVATIERRSASDGRCAELSEGTAPLTFLQDPDSAKRRGSRRLLSAVVIGTLLTVAVFSSAVLSWFAGHNARMAPDFTLIDQDGQPFTLSGLRGHPIALFFGYTHCPDECPTTLAHLARAVHAAGVSQDTRVAFITVDPDRDSPATLKRYVRLFDPKFIGLTAGLSRLDPVYNAYHVARQVVRVGQNKSDDSFEHGTTVYYVGRDGTIKGLGQWDDAMSDIARDFKDFQ